MCLPSLLRTTNIPYMDLLVLTLTSFAAVQVVFVGQVVEKDPQEVIKAALKATNCTC